MGKRTLGARLFRLGHRRIKRNAGSLRLAHGGGLFQTIVEEGPGAADLLKAGLDAGTWTDLSLHACVQKVLGAVSEQS